MRKLSVTVLALSALLLAVPGAQAKSSTRTKSRIAATVYAGPITRPKAHGLDFDQFFSSSVTIHRGDSVKWVIHGFHNIFLPVAGQTPPPFGMPAPLDPVIGARDASGIPFWFNGLPNFHLSPQVALPIGSGSYDGTGQVNSGVSPGAAKPFVLKFTKTGTFRYYCLIHPGMNGVVHVVAPARHAPSAGKQHAAAVREQHAALVLAARQANVKPPAKTVLAGHDSGPVTWLRFFPSVVNVHVGDSVAFKMSAPRENHTVTFGPAAYTGAIEKGLLQVNPNTGGGPPAFVINPIAFYASDPLSSPLPPYTGANHGNGFENSGFLAGRPGEGLPGQVTFTFTKAGTYHFECVLHQGMEGTVRVT